jgi:hypothetical protein
MSSRKFCPASLRLPVWSFCFQNVSLCLRGEDLLCKKAKAAIQIAAFG